MRNAGLYARVFPAKSAPKRCRTTELMGNFPPLLAASCLLWNLCATAQQPTSLLPDPKLTPGDVFDVTLQDIRTSGYSRKVRDLPRSLRNQAYSLYGATSPNQGDYQLDHLIRFAWAGPTRSGTSGRSPTVHRPGTRT
jgi:hypothetical protein